MIFNLHLHSTASDGEKTPAQLVELARQRGISVMALSDHDTMEGVTEAQTAGKALGVTVIPAIELSADFHGELHMLGYGLDREKPAFQDFVRLQQARRVQRNLAMVEKLQALGLPITLEECRQLAGGAGENWGRSHMGIVLFHNGACQSKAEAFDRWLGYGTPGYVSRERSSPEACIELIHRCGGMAVVAHPGQIPVDDHARVALIESLTEKGLDGLEAYYPQHSVAQAAAFARLARRLRLYTSYGSDYHGPLRQENGILGGWERHRPDEKEDNLRFLNRLMEANREG